MFLTWYSLFILAFGLSFYILLHKDNGQVINWGCGGSVG
jgi:hypothetical protein